MSMIYPLHNLIWAGLQLATASQEWAAHTSLQHWSLFYHADNYCKLIELLLCEKSL